VKNALTIIQFLIILVLATYLVYSKGEDRVGQPEQQVSPVLQPSQYKVFTFDLPKNLFFAGEAVPLEQADIRERLDREIHTNIYWNTNTVFLLKRANRWLPQIEAILIANNIPPDFKYVPVIESGLMNARSPKGAIGFWQILSSTGRELGLEINREVDERYDPIKSTVAACLYLRKAYKKFGSWTSVAASYNMGVRGFSTRLNEQKVTSYYDLLLNNETSRYVFRVLAIKELMEHPYKYGYVIPKKHLYQQDQTREVTVSKNINNLVEFSLEHDINYKLLKLYNPWLRKNSLTIKKPAKVYTILIPKNPPDFEVMATEIELDSGETWTDSSDIQIRDLSP